jgi:hypothetical protein
VGLEILKSWQKEDHSLCQLSRRRSPRHNGRWGTNISPELRAWFNSVAANAGYTSVVFVPTDEV